jgi:hypothetical protein
MRYDAQAYYAAGSNARPTELSPGLLGTALPQDHGA